MIGLTGTQTTVLEEKMAGNMRDRNLAFQAAESALRAGEVAAVEAEPTLSCPAANPPGFFLPRDENCDGTVETTDIWDNSNFDWDTESILYVDESLADLSANPRFIVEDMGLICPLVTACTSAQLRHNYRITARASGSTTAAVVILQSTIQV